LLRDISNGVEVPDSVLEANDLRIGIVAFAYLALVLVSLVVFLVWVHRTAQNAHSFSKKVEHSPGWCVGWFFIPIMNLFRPFQAMKQVWEASATSGQTSGIVNAWWTFYIISGIIAQFSMRIGARAESVEELMNSDLLDLVISPVDFVLCILTILLIRKLSVMQSQKNRSLHEENADGNFLSDNCPKCGEEVDRSQSICQMCGADLD